jgi:hypothetical protein
MLMAQLREANRRERARRRDARRLRQDLSSFRTASERAELEAILERHGTTLTEVLRAGR